VAQRHGDTAPWLQRRVLSGYLSMRGHQTALNRDLKELRWGNSQSLHWSIKPSSCPLPCEGRGETL